MCSLRTRLCYLNLVFLCFFLCLKKIQIGNQGFIGFMFLKTVLENHFLKHKEH